MIGVSGKWGTIFSIASFFLVCLQSTLATCPPETKCMELVNDGPSIEECLSEIYIEQVFEFCIESHYPSSAEVLVVGEIKDNDKNKSLRGAKLSRRRLQGNPCRRCGGLIPQNDTKTKDPKQKEKGSLENVLMSGFEDFDKEGIGSCLCDRMNFFMEVRDCGEIFDCSFEWCD